MPVGLSCKYKWLLRVRLFVYTCPVLVGFIFLFKLSKPLAIASITVYFSVMLVVFCLYVPIYVKGYSLLASSKAICVKRGVIFKRSFFVPFSDALFCDSVQTPLSAMFGIKAVRIHLMRRTLTIDGISRSDAQLLLARFTVK